MPGRLSLYKFGRCCGRAGVSEVLRHSDSHAFSLPGEISVDAGQQIVLVPPTAPVVTVAPGVKSDVTVGTVVFINAVQEDDKVSAAAVFVGLNFL